MVEIPSAANDVVNVVSFVAISSLLVYPAFRIWLLLLRGVVAVCCRFGLHSWSPKRLVLPDPVRCNHCGKLREVRRG